MMKNDMENSFQLLLVLLILYLRRQNTLWSQMVSTFWNVRQTRWSFRGSLTTWQARHREQIRSYPDQKNLSFFPSSYWWLTASAFIICVSLINSCTMSRQSNDTIVPKHNERIKMLLQKFQNCISNGGLLNSCKPYFICRQAWRCISCSKYWRRILGPSWRSHEIFGSYTAHWRRWSQRLDFSIKSRN